MLVPYPKPRFASILLLLLVLGVGPAAAQGSPFGAIPPLNGPIPPGIPVPLSLRSMLQDLLFRIKEGVDRRSLPPGSPIACGCQFLTVIPTVIPEDSTSRFSPPDAAHLRGRQPCGRRAGYDGKPLVAGD